MAEYLAECPGCSPIFKIMCQFLLEEKMYEELKLMLSKAEEDNMFFGDIAIKFL